MRQCRKFVQLAPADRSLLVSAAFLVVWVRLGLWLLPFRTLRRTLSRLAGASTGRQGSPGCAAERPVWAVRVVSRYVPGSTCLTQALAAHALLARHGYSADLQIGFTRDDAKRLQGHAWLEHEGEVVIGGGELERYVPLTTLNKQPASR